MRTEDSNNQPSDDSSYLERISKIQDLTLGLLHDGSQKMLPEVAELCEDIGNLYLNIADEIHAGKAARFMDQGRSPVQAEPNQ